MYSNEQIIECVANQLEKNPEWRIRFNGYADDILKMMDEKVAFGRLFQTRDSLHIYSTTTQSGTEFQIRFAGKIVGIVKYDSKSDAPTNKERIFLTVKEDHLRVAKSLGYEGCAFDRERWNGKAASNYRSFFKSQERMSSKELTDAFNKANLGRGKEARVESKLLVEFKKGKLIHNINSVSLCGAFFQCATPLSASDHKDKPKYTKIGGGIDILARTTHGSNRDNRLAVMEVKDSDEYDTQADALSQAIAYATFLAYLLRDNKCGNKWWKLFGKGKQVPPELHIDAVTIMPEGCDSVEGEMIPLEVSGLKNVKIYPSALYFKQDEKGNIIGFSGKLKDEIDK